MTSRFNILSISGGGFFGLYSIAIIAALEKEFGEPIAKHFDLIAGTSIGGIIALGLSAEIPAKKIQEAFEENGPIIFSNRPAAQTNLDRICDFMRMMLRPKYDSLLLHNTISSILGETKMGELKHRTIIPSVNLTKGQPQIFKTPHNEILKSDLHLFASDVAIATSAAPTYFPLAEVNNSLYADGGMFANSPDLLALHEAKHFLKQSEEIIHVLSIGTTTAQYSFAHANGRNLGIYGWFQDQRLVNTIIASQQQMVDFMMSHRLDQRYLRLDIIQSKDHERHLALDVATENAQKTLQGLSAATFQKEISNPILRGFFNHIAPSPTFYNG